jgi:hypothetical protein
MNKQTAVQWLVQWLNDNPVVYQKDYYAAIEWAKALEKEQIEQAFKIGQLNFKNAFTNGKIYKDENEYYNETYGGDK